MDEEQKHPLSQMEALAEIFRAQLVGCLEEALQGRRGLFSAPVQLEEGETEWVAAERLRELAGALQGVFAQNEDRFPLCDEFLDLCTMHGEYHPGERKLARAFLDRIERGEVGTPTEEPRPW
jgi:hypothetical protein